MDVQLDFPSEGYGGRLEVIEGPTGRRRRTEAEKARIVAESLMPGVGVAEVARKYGVTRWQVYDWRKRLRQVSDAARKHGRGPRLCGTAGRRTVSAEAGERPH
ncbi:transposase [Mesorhizobium sp. M0590]|uniref:transposase n=1 Tax=Mesorhizobium sp. M0590 TaxID=2956966 RepID=UPI003336FA3B